MFHKIGPETEKAHGLKVLSMVRGVQRMKESGRTEGRRGCVDVKKVGQVVRGCIVKALVTDDVKIEGSTKCDLIESASRAVPKEERYGESFSF